MTQNKTKMFLNLADFLIKSKGSCYWIYFIVLTTFIKLIMGHFSSSQTGKARDGAGLEAFCAVKQPNQISYVKS